MTYMSIIETNRCSQEHHTWTDSIIECLESTLREVSDLMNAGHKVLEVHIVEDTTTLGRPD